MVSVTSRAGVPKMASARLRGAWAAVVAATMASVASVASAAPAADAIHELPGWDAPLPSQMYSGYINVTQAMGMPMMVHYWFVEMEGEAAGADADPTLLWTNGGPGASSMFGLLVELGPLLLNVDSLQTESYKATGVPTLFRNDFAWTKLGSVLMFDWPPPVGFSYCGGDPTGDGHSCGDWDDERMAKLTYAALSGWFDAFPERRAHPLYLTGESYAGIYVPMLAEQILKRADPGVLPQLKGFAVGDGCLGTDSGVCGAHPVWTDLIFLYGHHQISSALFDEIVSVCGWGYIRAGGTPPPGCEASLGKVAGEAGGYFAYSLYDDCIYSEGTRRRRSRRLGAAAVGADSGSLKLLGFSDADGPHMARRTLGGHNSAHENNYVCAGDSTVVWSNSSAVRQALHVPVNSAFFNGDNGAGMTYKQTRASLKELYLDVAASTKLRVLTYNGDTDPAVNSFAVQNWTLHLGYTPTQEWRPWTLDGCRRMGGYVTRYEDQRYDFLTIRGAGHMVPQYRPEPAYQFLRSWLAGEDFKAYDKDCVAPVA